MIVLSKIWPFTKRILFSDYFKDNIIRVSILCSLALNIVLWFYIRANIKSSPYSIALHYTIYFGMDMLGRAEQALLIAVVGFVILVTNVILSYHIFRYNILAAYFLGFTSILVQFFLLLAVYGLVLINK